jgi:hypothetical protein
MKDESWNEKRQDSEGVGGRMSDGKRWLILLGTRSAKHLITE